MGIVHDLWKKVEVKVESGKCFCVLCFFGSVTSVVHFHSGFCIVVQKNTKVEVFFFCRKLEAFAITPLRIIFRHFDRERVKNV